MTPDRKTKRKLVRAARKLVRRRYPEVNPAGACVFSGVAIAKLASDAGFPLRLYAGSAFWRGVSPAMDDGISATRFGYQFDPEEARPRYEAGMLPELHVWAGTTEGVVVDITTKWWPQRARELADMRWSEPLPPDFFWGHRDELPPETEYVPHPIAQDMVVHLLTQD